jgi:lipopolysaccharide biosynthesis regulator YciM
MPHGARVAVVCQSGSCGAENRCAIMPAEPRQHRITWSRRQSWIGHLRRRNTIVVVLFVLAGIAAGLIAFTVLRKGWTQWYKGRLLKQASAQLEENHLEKAEEMARRALAIDRNSLDAARLLADLTEKENLSETVTWRAQIARLQPGLNNQLNLASAALRFGQLDLARHALEQVPAGDRDKAAYQIVAGWLSRAEGNKAEEEKHFAAAVAQEPSNDLYKFNLAVLQIHSPDQDKVAAARTELQRLSKVPQFRTEALRALLADAVQHNETELADDLAQQLQMSPQVTFADYLLCLDLYRKLSAKSFDALLDKVKPVAARTPHDTAQLIDWLNQHKLASEALKWSDKLPTRLTNRSPVAPAVAESLALTKNWTGLKRWTRSRSWGDDNYLRFAYLAYATRQGSRDKDSAEFRSLWRKATRAAEKHPDHQLTLARLASKWGLNADAERLWLQLAKTPATRREALDALYRIFREKNDLTNLTLTAQRLHEASPDEPALSANLARLMLLREPRSARGVDLARTAYEKAPDDPAVAITYAFALCNDGRASEGLDVVEKIPPEHWRDPHTALYVALLFAANGQFAQANRYVAAAKSEAIYPEEKQLLRRIMTLRREIASSPNESKSSPSPSPDR